MTPVVSIIAPTDAERALQVILRAFERDPMARWSFPDPQTYRDHFPVVIRALGGRSFAQGSAHEVDGYAGVALWMPPGVEPDHETLEALMTTSDPTPLQREVAAVVEQMAHYHPPGPHWFLPFIAVDPVHQHKGHGSTLLAHALRQCDRDHLPAYLESSNLANIPLYQRHGFEVLGTIQVGSSPPLTPMLRRAR
ncbi:MAG TPA: GNAT family N-acetyltransferase [Vineibacter sp.]|nr:GNAT family N-acetyltransferase [Vineibacter sp.]